MKSGKILQLCEYLSAKVDLVNQKLSPKVSFSILMLVSVLFILPVIFANTDYIDDSGRRVSGYTNYSDSGRFGIEFIVRVLSLSTGYLPDVGIFFQVLSIPILAMSGWVVYRSLDRISGKGDKISQLLVAISVVANPFILTNMSFRFDSLGMSIAYLLAIYAAVIIMRPHRGLKSYGIAGLLILFSAMTYQPMILMTLGVISIIFLAGILDPQKTHRSSVIEWIRSIAVFLVSMIVYLIIFKLTQSPRMDNDSRANIISPNIEGLEIASYNVLELLKITKIYYFGTAELTAIFGLLFIATIITTLVLIVKNTHMSLYLQKIGMLIGGLVVFTAAVIGPFVLLENPLTSMRTLASAGLVITLCIIPFMFVKNKVASSMLILLTLVVVVSSLSLSFIYGAALKNQRDYDKAVQESVIKSIGDNYDTIKNQDIYIGTGIGTPRSVRIAESERPVLKKMNIATSNDIWFIRQSIIDFDIDGLHLHQLKGGICGDSPITPIEVEEGPFHKLYKSERGYIYVLKVSYRDNAPLEC